MPAPPLPSGALNRLSIRAFNELYYRYAPRRRRDELQSITRFFYPLDMAGGWNRWYGDRGFLQWQFVLPFGEEALLSEHHRGAGRPGRRQLPHRAQVLRRRQPRAPVVPRPRVDAEPRRAGPHCRGLAELLDRLDRQVADAGGRVYFAKDSRMRAELVPVMYPRLDEWRAVRDRLDPDRRITSDLARRLRLLG